MSHDNAVGVSKHDPLVVLADLIQEGVPELANQGDVIRTVVGRQDASRIQTWPSLVVWVPDGAKWTIEWTQDDVIARYPLDHATKPGRPTDYRVPGTFPATGSLGRIVVRKGWHMGLVQLRLGARSDKERARLEQRILEVFAAVGGDLLAQVPDCANAWHKWEMGESTWRDGAAFDKVLESELDLQAVHPLLVEVRNVRIMETVQLRFTEDLTTAFDSIPSGRIEAFNIQPDGTIERVAP